MNFQEVPLGPNIQPVCLPGPYTGPSTKDVCMATGCGNMAQDKLIGKPKQDYAIVLQQVDLEMTSASSCAEINPTLTPEMICAGNDPSKDA